jgi:predicted metal-dependent phosphoesterase TrpH
VTSKTIPNGLWRVETHSHTHYSKDCLTTFKNMVKRCRELGIDKIIITDHNTAEGALQWAQWEPDLFIVGEEIMTPQGEILAFFMHETIPPFLSPDETIQRLRDQGAFISVSHPFDRLRKGAWAEADLDKIIDKVDAIEVFNARCFTKKENDAAQAYAETHGVLGTVGSDAHHPFEVGKANLLMQPFEGASSFMESLKTAQHLVQLSPHWVHGISTVAKWQRKYFRRPMPLKNGDIR